jgi:hypothetical protein
MNIICLVTYLFCLSISLSHKGMSHVIKICAVSWNEYNIFNNVLNTHLFLLIFHFPLCYDQCNTFPVTCLFFIHSRLTCHISAPFFGFLITDGVHFFQDDSFIILFFGYLKASTSIKKIQDFYNNRLNFSFRGFI